MEEEKYTKKGARLKLNETVLFVKDRKQKQKQQQEKERRVLHSLQQSSYDQDKITNSQKMHC